MTILLDNIPIPEQGTLTINLTIEIKVTAEQARKKVDHWLMDQVSYMIGAKEPSLAIVGKQGVWRVPAWIGFSGNRWEGVVGSVDVNVETGEMIDLEGSKARIIEYLEKEVKPKLPPYQRSGPVAPEFIPKNVPPAKKLVVGEDGFLKPAE